MMEKEVFYNVTKNGRKLEMPLRKKKKKMMMMIRFCRMEQVCLPCGNCAKILQKICKKERKNE